METALKKAVEVCEDERDERNHAYRFIEWQKDEILNLKEHCANLEHENKQQKERLRERNSVIRLMSRDNTGLKTLVRESITADALAQDLSSTQTATIVFANSAA